ncbi:zinc finger protein 185 [Sphaerodactylus townsendi]|nr:zinc finger protein 185 [Sphaerodactylus townsendi]
MLSLSSMKDGAIVPSEEDRKKLLTQMKVKTTLRSDKSWIQKKSDSEEEKNHSPLHSPLRSRKTSERASISPKVSPLNHRAVFEELSSQSEQPFPVAKQPPKKSHHTTSPSGYLIRGVFTKTVDKNAPSNNVSNGLQKSAKNASSTLGYKMSTEDYKKLAPYTVKRDTAPDHIDPPVSPDEQQKRYLPRPEERPVFTSSFSTPPPQPRYPSSSGYDSDPTTSSKALLFVKESINSTEMSSTPRYNSRSMVDLSTLERSKCSSGSGSYMQCSQPTWPTEDICTYCGREIRNCPKIKIEKLNICCHEFCFRCGICHKPMGDLLDKIFIHRDIVHCDKCYEKLF